MTNTTEQQQQKRGSLIAGIGALVGIGAFLLLPYLSITTAIVAPTGYTGQLPSAYSQTVTVGTGAVAIFTGLIWIEALLAIAAVAIAALVMWREAPFGNSKLPVATQLRRASYTILALGIAGIVFQFLFVTIGNSQINSAIQSAASNSSSGTINIFASLAHFSVTLGYGIGSWLYLLSMGAVIAGGVLMLRAAGVSFLAPQATAQPQTWQQPAGQYPQQTGQYAQQPWQQPQEPQQPW